MVRGGLPRYHLHRSYNEAGETRAFRAAFVFVTLRCTSSFACRMRVRIDQGYLAILEGRHGRPSGRARQTSRACTNLISPYEVQALCAGYNIASLFLPVSAIRRGPQSWPSSSNHIGGVMDEAHRGTASPSGRSHRSTSACT